MRHSLPGCPSVCINKLFNQLVLLRVCIMTSKDRSSIPVSHDAVYEGEGCAMLIKTQEQLKIKYINK